MCNRHPLSCIIPPYMNLKLANNDKFEKKLLAAHVSSYTIDAQIRARRKAFTRLNRQGKEIMALAALKKPSKKIAMNREVYTAGNKQVQPGTLVRKEGQAESKDKDVNNVYDASGYTWDFYYSLFQRNSIDNKGLKLIQTVHFGKKYDNAFWDGQQMIYGDGDGKIFDSFTSDIDIVGHELTHGVVQYETNLAYQDQSGALNESLADIFGSMIKQRVLNQDAASADWLIGENVLRGKQYALRSLKAPGTAYKNHPDLGTDPQPAQMSGYTNDPFDNGGVHLNSGITNHAFYLACVDVGGFSWEKVGRVWYAAMCDKKGVPTTASFLDFKNATIGHAEKLFKGEKTVAQAIKKAWDSVGVE